MTTQSLSFEPYTIEDPACAVVAITPPGQAHVHTYYDLTPWSPSGRYLTSLRLPYEDRHPQPGDVAEVCVIDLVERTVRPVYETHGWGFQKGAHQQWGRTDRYLYFNDVQNNRPVGVRLDVATGEAWMLEGPVWQISPDETFAICPCLIRANLTQKSYGVSVAPAYEVYNTVRAAEDDGLYRVDLQTGKQTLLVSLAQIWEHLDAREDLDAATVLYAFHAKFNAQGTRILLVVRGRTPDGGYRPQMVTFDPDGSDIRTVVNHHQWAQGGHHPMWYPDGKRILMCRVHDDTGYHFSLVDGWTGEVSNVVDEPYGTGHPIANRDQTLLITDATYEETGVRRVAARLVDLRERTWRDVCWVESPLATGEDHPLRRDAHFTWDREGRRFLFVGAPGGKRQLFVADPGLPPGTAMSFEDGLSCD